MNIPGVSLASDVKNHHTNLNEAIFPYSGVLQEGTRPTVKESCSLCCGNWICFRHDRRLTLKPVLLCPLGRADLAAVVLE